MSIEGVTLLLHQVFKELHRPIAARQQSLREHLPKFRKQSIDYEGSQPWIFGLILNLQVVAGGYALDFKLTQQGSRIVIHALNQTIHGIHAGFVQLVRRCAARRCAAQHRVVFLSERGRNSLLGGGIQLEQRFRRASKKRVPGSRQVVDEQLMGNPVHDLIHFHQLNKVVETSVDFRLLYRLLANDELADFIDDARGHTSPRNVGVGKPPGEVIAHRHRHQRHEQQERKSPPQEFQEVGEFVHRMSSSFLPVNASSLLLAIRTSPAMLTLLCS